VDSTCPNAFPDSHVPGLFYSYDACSDDYDTLAKCKWQDVQANCSNRTLSIAALARLQEKTSFEFSATFSDGIVIFNSLHSKTVGSFELVVQVKTANGNLIWRSNQVILIRAQSAKLMKLTALPKQALPGKPLSLQPAVQLTDIFENPVYNDKICTSVTASVVSWNGKTVSSIGIQSARRFIYGQRIGDDNLYPPGCSSDPNLICRLKNKKVTVIIFLLVVFFNIYIVYILFWLFNFKNNLFYQLLCVTYCLSREKR
jgi:hypothetical protein